jgi:hypothetical protein
MLFLSLLLPISAIAAEGGGGSSSSRNMYSLGLGIANDGDGDQHMALLAHATYQGYAFRSGYWGASYADSRVQVATNILAAGYDSQLYKFSRGTVGGQAYLTRACDQTVTRLPGSSTTYTENSVAGGFGFGMDYRTNVGRAILRTGWESHLYFGDLGSLLFMASIKKTVLFLELGGAL